MYWCHINSAYLKYLRKYDKRVPFDNYGKNKYKPFFKPLFRVGNGIVYVGSVSHSQNKHNYMKNNKYFLKVYLKGKNGDQVLTAVIHLNYMFPVPESLITNVNRKNIDNYRTFRSDIEKSQYIHLLKLERKEIKSMNVKDKAFKLYNFVNNNPNTHVANVCINYKKLERKSKQYLEEKSKQYYE